MISDSVPWREALLRGADFLEQQKIRQRWTERGVYLIERELFIAFYAIRRLLEAYRISDALASSVWPATKHALSSSKRPDLLSYQDVPDYYETDEGEAVNLPLRVLCNQVIHSYVLTFQLSEDRGLKGLWIASDRQRGSAVYFVEMDAIVALLRAVGSEEIVSVTIVRDANGEAQVANLLGQPYLGN